MAWFDNRLPVHEYVRNVNTVGLWRVESVNLTNKTAVLVPCHDDRHLRLPKANEPAVTVSLNDLNWALDRE
jgi:hypothetical protein